jgi:hypothetical protein
VYDGDCSLAIPDREHSDAESEASLEDSDASGVLSEEDVDPTLTRTDKKMNKFDEEMKNTLLM